MISGRRGNRRVSSRKELARSGNRRTPLQLAASATSHRRAAVDRRLDRVALSGRGPAVRCGRQVTPSSVGSTQHRLGTRASARGISRRTHGGAMSMMPVLRGGHCGHACRGKCPASGHQPFQPRGLRLAIAGRWPVSSRGWSGTFRAHREEQDDGKPIINDQFRLSPASRAGHGPGIPPPARLARFGGPAFSPC